MARRSAWRHTSGVNNMTSLLEREAGFCWRAARNLRALRLAGTMQDVQAECADDLDALALMTNNARLRSLAIEASATSDVAAVKPRAGA